MCSISTSATMPPSPQDTDSMVDIDEIMIEDSGSELTSTSSLCDNDADYDLSFNGASNNEINSYKVEFTVLSGNDLAASQAEQVGQVTAVLDVSSTVAAALLRHYRWDKEKLFEGFMDSPETVLRLAGASVDKNNTSKGVLQFAHQLDLDSFCCKICFDDDTSIMTACAPCGHRFCLNCYRHYLQQKISEEGVSQHLVCPHTKCTVVVDEGTVQQILMYAGDQTATKGDEGTVMKYMQLLNKAFVDDNDHLRWCPAPDCKYAVECHVPATSLRYIVPTVRCACNHEFCFGCNSSDHQPAVCSMVKMWTKQCIDDSKNAMWMASHTKECPKCYAIIEKNGGCNYMRCRKCQHSFCWVCLNSLEGTHHCNRFHSSTASASEDARQWKALYLKRYLHYYERYNNHENSAKLDQVLYEKTECNMRKMQQRSDLSWIEVQFLKTAVDVAVKCRTTLKWSYVFAYYLNKTNETHIFEDNQKDLELATEQLSQLLETSFDETKWKTWRRDVLDKTAYVKGRRETLLYDTAKGLSDERWTFGNLPE